MKALGFLSFRIAAVASFVAVPRKHCGKQKASPLLVHAAERQDSYALLVDAENVSHPSFSYLMEHLEQHRGMQMPIRRIFGKPRVLLQDPWQAIILDYSFVPIFCQGLADMDLALDAMDILYTKDFIRGFVLCSSDSDFTRLVQRIRENDLLVLGVGERSKTSLRESLPKACHEFLYLEDLVEIAEQRSTEAEDHESEILIEKAEPEAVGQEVAEEPPRRRAPSPLFDIRKGWLRVGRAFGVEKKNAKSSDGSLSSSSALFRNGKGSYGSSEELQTTAVADAEFAIPNGMPASSSIVETLKDELKTISPGNEWVQLSFLTERSSITVQDTGYKKMSDFIKSHSGDFDLKLVRTTFKVRLRK